jgi:hypothetical protein
MRVLLPAGLLGLAVLFQVSCTNESKKPETPANNSLKWDIRQASKKACVNDVQCANFQVYFPVFNGGDSLATQAISSAVQSLILSTVGGNAALPFEAALDSAGAVFCQQFVDFKRENPENELGYDLSVVTNVLLGNAKILSVEMSGSSYAGGAHPNSFATLVTFDLSRKGQPLLATEIISDTIALLPQLELAYKTSKGMDASGDITELLLQGVTKLPMPLNVCIVPEGVRFYYGDYEVAPHAIGPADLLLTWEQLGPLADKNKWL